MCLCMHVCIRSTYDEADLCLMCIYACMHASTSAYVHISVLRCIKCVLSSAYVYILTRICDIRVGMHIYIHYPCVYANTVQCNFKHIHVSTIINGWRKEPAWPIKLSHYLYFSHTINNFQQLNKPDNPRS